MSSVDIDAANRLLNQKYSKEEPTEDRIKPMLRQPLNNKPEMQVNWELLARERHEVMCQMRDQANAWWEAWKLEKERGDRLEKLLLDPITEKENEETQGPGNETKISLSSQEQIQSTRASWPRVKRQLESLHRDFGERSETA